MSPWLGKLGDHSSRFDVKQSYTYTFIIITYPGGGGGGEGTQESIRGGQNPYPFLSHVINNTANQKARNPLHILRYATGSIPRKNPGVPRGLQIFPAGRLIEEPATGQNFHSEKITVNN